MLENIALLFIMLYAGLWELGSKNFQISSNEEKTASSTLVFRLYFRFLSPWFNRMCQRVSLFLW